MSERSEEVLDRARLDARHEQIRQVYCADRRPWVIGYSGGKDSTTALQLIWTALSALAREELSKPVYIIASDTLVETPKIVDYIDGSLARMNSAAAQMSLPFSAHKVRPVLEKTFWVNLLGRGFPAPSKRFRWCTERLKIDPANQFILQKVTEHGEVVVVLGVRRSESSTRAQVMNLHRIKGSALSRHTTLPNAFVYTPVEDFTVEDVWTYLLQVPSPWGNNNRDLVTMYRNAQAGECPLVVDRTTPSCGNSRFGCWVCTVVTKDKSMEAMIEHGDEWLEPLLEYRDLLASTQDPAVKGQLRRRRRRNGQTTSKLDGTPIYGPYKLEVRKDLLRRLLSVQRQVCASGPNPNEQLITPEELERIRALWRSEEADWEDSVPQIYREVMGTDREWIADEHSSFSADDKRLLGSICQKYGVPSEMAAKLLDVEREFHGLSRRSSVHHRIASVFDEDWGADEAFLAEHTAGEMDSET
jgi:DNA sulfur modification protein DndC